MKIIGIGLAAFALFAIQFLIYEKFWNKNLKVTAFFKQAGITEGETGEIVEIIENAKWLPLPMLKVKFQTSRNLCFLDNRGSNATDQYYRNDIFHVGGREKITRTLKFTGTKRGYYQIKNIDMVASDLFLIGENVSHQTTGCFIYVYPKQFLCEEFRLSLQKLNGEIQVKRHLLEDVFSYRGIREYQPYDDMRSVNWKATARTGGLMVNQRGYSAMQTIRIFLNLEDTGIWKKDDEVESSMQIAMGLAAFFLQQGIKVSCYANGKDIFTDAYMEIEGGAGISQLDTIGKAFARIDTQKGTWSFCELFQERILAEADGSFTFFISPNGYDDFTTLLELCGYKGMEYCWYYPVANSDDYEINRKAKKLEATGRLVVLPCYVR